MGDIVYSKVRTLGLCLRTTFSIAKNETSSLTRIYVGPFTAQIKCPRDWQLRGVDATGGRTGQSFPLHILSDKILLFSNARHAGSRYVMLWVSSVSVQSRTSSRLAEIQTATHSFIWFLSQQPSSSRKILLVLGRNFIEVQTLSKRVWLWLETWDEKKKHRVVHMALGEIENRWRQETNQTTIKSFQIRPLLTHKTTKPHTGLLFLLSALFLFALSLQWTSLQLFSCQHRVWKSSPGSA